MCVIVLTFIRVFENSIDLTGLVYFAMVAIIIITIVSKDSIIPHVVFLPNKANYWIQHVTVNIMDCHALPKTQLDVGLSPDQIKITRGVPQGDTLKPLLFELFIANMHELV
uniref:Reverse transcriptase domain-containing protein n=1 Tax=Photinus pyralis TaxID=7054 RepID=A0A1Y1LC43_PHOPY